MNNFSKVFSVIAVIVVGSALAGCKDESRIEATTSLPPPHAGAVELGLGETYQGKNGQRITVFQIAHRQTLPEENWQAQQAAEREEKLTGLAAEVQFCNLSKSNNPEPSALSTFRLIQESEFSMNGKSIVTFNVSGQANLGMKTPLLENAPLDDQGCRKGWIDFINVYDEHGKPLKLGYLEDFTNPDSFAVVWPAGE